LERLKVIGLFSSSKIPSFRLYWNETSVTEVLLWVCIASVIQSEGGSMPNLISVLFN
jgi:hypothetical protein